MQWCDAAERCGVAAERYGRALPQSDKAEERYSGAIQQSNMVEQYTSGVIWRSDAVSSKMQRILRVVVMVMSD
jgi:hypothetical protein